MIEIEYDPVQALAMQIIFIAFCLLYGVLGYILGIREGRRIERERQEKKRGL